MTLPSLLLVTLAWLAALPLVVAAATIVDLVRGGPWPILRCCGYLTVYLVAELTGVVAAFGVWLGSGVWAGAARAPYLRRNLALQSWWANFLYRGAERLFALRTVVEGDEVVTPGPIILFIRHVSQADTLLPVVYVTRRHGIALRFVLKRELLWDPCLDIVGHRLPNVFVRRGSGESAREVAAVQRLVEDLGPNDGVLIYPEGTRFTARKRERVLEKLASRATSDLLQRAHALRHVLPPQVGGALGLLERNPGADVVVCAHTGLEAAGSPAALLGGALVGATVRVRFWRLPYEEIPTEREARIAWVYHLWNIVDDWIDEVYPLSG